MGVGSLLVHISAVGPSILQPYISVSIACTLATLDFIRLPEIIRRVYLYLFVITMFYVSFSGAHDFWLRAESNCAPDGSHFPITHYLSYTKFVSPLTSIVRVSLCQRYFGVRTGFQISLLPLHVVQHDGLSRF